MKKNSPTRNTGEAPSRTERAETKIKRKDYEKELERLQAELCALQDWVRHTGQRIVIVFEGRDAAGKGGIIKAITERISPRVVRVVALPTPSDREKSQMYVQRYLNHFPAAGEIVLFDRSWYNRAGIEFVFGFCTAEQHGQFLTVCPQFERHVVDNASASSSTGSRWATRSRNAVSKRASRTPCGSGSSRLPIWNRAGAGTPTRAPAIGCSTPPTPTMHPGTSCNPITSASRGSTASRTS
jgi:hypothetical protein